MPAPEASTRTPEADGEPAHRWLVFQGIKLELEGNKANSIDSQQNDPEVKTLLYA